MIEVDATKVEVQATARLVPSRSSMISWRSRPTGNDRRHYYEAKKRTGRHGGVPAVGLTALQGAVSRLAQDLPNHRIARPGPLPGPERPRESTVDTILGMRYLESQGVSADGLVSTRSGARW